MFFYTIEGRIYQLLQNTLKSWVYPFIVAGLAFMSAITVSFPFSSVLIPAVLINQKKWRSICFDSALFATIASGIWILLFHHLGWSQIAAHYPEMVGSVSWLKFEKWIFSYGALALFFIAASPLPLFPALAIVGLLRIPIFEAVFALFCGKCLKYSFYAWIAVQFPERLKAIRRHVFFSKGS